MTVAVNKLRETLEDVITKRMTSEDEDIHRGAVEDLDILTRHEPTGFRITNADGHVVVIGTDLWCRHNNHIINIRWADCPEIKSLSRRYNIEIGGV